MLGVKKDRLPDAEEALPGRREEVDCGEVHLVSGRPLRPPMPAGIEEIVFAMGCFWGAERRFWQQEGVYSTAVGYAGGFTPNPGYDEVCSGQTGHTEVVRVFFDPAKVDLAQLLTLFWESHDPTQGMRQGNDRGTQYRSAIYTTSAGQERAATLSRDLFQQQLQAAGFGTITTEIMPLRQFYYAEAYHQQYLARNPQGYCGLKGTGARLDAAGLSASC
jgi:peptide-methionine (S)-S-oxide reductase